MAKKWLSPTLKKVSLMFLWKANISPTHFGLCLNICGTKFLSFCGMGETFLTGTVPRLDSPVANAQSGFDSPTKAPRAFYPRKIQSSAKADSLFAGCENRTPDLGL